MSDSDTYEPIFVTFGEAYMDGNADAFGEVHGYLTGAAIGTENPQVRQAFLEAAAFVASRQRDCAKARWTIRDERKDQAGA
jgi:hypothetical protein